MPTIFTPITLPSFQTSELLAEAAIILPKFLAETHNHQEAAQKRQENSIFFFKGKDWSWFSWEQSEQSCVRKSTFIFVFFTSSGGENTSEGSASGLWGGNAALRGSRINLLCAKPLPTALFAHPSGLRGSYKHPGGIRMFLVEEKIRSAAPLLPPWAIKCPEQSGCTPQLLFSPHLLFEGAICGYTKPGGSSVQVSPVTRSWAKAPLTILSVKNQGDDGQQEQQNMEWGIVAPWEWPATSHWSANMGKK